MTSRLSRANRAGPPEANRRGPDLSLIVTSGRRAALSGGLDVCVIRLASAEHHENAPVEEKVELQLEQEAGISFSIPLAVVSRCL